MMKVANIFHRNFENNYKSIRITKKNEQLKAIKRESKRIKKTKK